LRYGSSKRVPSGSWRSLARGRAKFNVFTVRSEELIEDRPELMAVVRPLLKARQATEQQTDDLDRKVLKLARYDACRREVRESHATVVPGTECLERGLRSGRPIAAARPRHP
jgi:hypothetical protein